MSERPENRITELVNRVNARQTQLVEDLQREMGRLAPEMLAAGVSLEDARLEYLGMDNGLAGPADWSFTRAYLIARKAAEQATPEPSRSVPE